MIEKDWIVSHLCYYNCKWDFEGGFLTSGTEALKNESAC